MQSVFKGRFQNWQRKLSKDKNKKSWLCVSQELITPCWFWAEERWLEMVSRDGVKGGTGLHSLVTTSSLAELGEVSLWDRSGRKGMSPAKSRGKGEHIVFRGWSWSVWLHVASKHQPPKQSVPVLPLHQPLWCPCLLLFTSFTLFLQPGKKRSQSPCHSARWNLEVAQDMSECSNYVSVILRYRKQLTAVMEILLKNQEQWFVSCFKSNFSLVPCRSAS